MIKYIHSHHGDSYYSIDGVDYPCNSFERFSYTGIGEAWCDMCDDYDYFFEVHATKEQVLQHIKALKEFVDMIGLSKDFTHGNRKYADQYYY